MAKALEISIIIPVFNAEKHLDRCVSSVLESLGNIPGEIILVNNNSTDNSLKLIQKYLKNHPKIFRSLDCRIKGAAAARNLGAKNAKGKYIWFIDADDTISKDAISKLLHEADAKHADITMLGAKRIKDRDHTDYLSAVDADEENYKSRFIRYGMGPWQVLIRREWWQKYDFKFKAGIIHEDMELMSSLILYTDKYASVDQPLYNYYNNQGSVLHKSQFNPHIFDIFPALEGLYQRFANQNAVKKYHSELEWFFIWNLLIDSAKDFAKFPEGNPGFARSRATLKKYFPNWRRNKFLRQKPIKLQLRVRLNYKKNSK